MKIVFTNEYAKACGICSINYHEDSKILRQGADSAVIIYNNEVVASFSNKIVKEIVLDE